MFQIDLNATNSLKGQIYPRTLETYGQRSGRLSRKLTEGLDGYMAGGVGLKVRKYLLPGIGMSDFLVATTVRVRRPSKIG